MKYRMEISSEAVVEDGLSISPASGRHMSSTQVKSGFAGMSSTIVKLPIPAEDLSDW
jgi:hypothetical protein